jgi:hypothetical protein
LPDLKILEIPVLGSSKWKLHDVKKPCMYVHWYKCMDVKSNL